MNVKLKNVIIAFVCIVCIVSGSVGVNAETVSKVPSTGGALGIVFYTLSAGNNYSSPGGASMYAITATAQQVADSTGSYKPITGMTFKYTIYLSSGGLSSGTSPTYTSINKTYISNKVYEPAVTRAEEKGIVVISITTDYYGTITKTVKNN